MPGRPCSAFIGTARLTQASPRPPGAPAATGRVARRRAEALRHIARQHAEPGQRRHDHQRRPPRLAAERQVLQQAVDEQPELRQQQRAELGRRASPDVCSSADAASCRLGWSAASAAAGNRRREGLRLRYCWAYCLPNPRSLRPAPVRRRRPGGHLLRLRRPHAIAQRRVHVRGGRPVRCRCRCRCRDAALDQRAKRVFDCGPSTKAVPGARGRAPAPPCAFCPGRNPSKRAVQLNRCCMVLLYGRGGNGHLTAVKCP